MAPGARGYALLAWIIVFTVLCLVVLTLRAWAAVVAKRKFYADDAFVVFAFANTIALEGVAIWAIWHGLGKHTDQVSPEDFAVQFKLILAADATWLLGTVFIKFSVLWLYTRIFCVQAFKRWSYTLIGVVAAYGVAFFILFMSRCVPASQQWHPTANGHCRDIYLDQVTSVSINMVIDIAIVALPLPVLWNLQLAVRSKIAVTVMFSIGLLTIGIMIWRLHFTVTTRNDKDFVWNLFNVGLISFLELWLGIIVACIPTLAPLLKTYVKPVITKMTQRSARSNARTGKDSLGSTADSRIAKPISSRQYSQLDEPSKSHLIEQEMHELNGANMVTTNCHYDPRTTPLPVYQQEGIYIQRDVVATRYE